MGMNKGIGGTVMNSTEEMDIFDYKITVEKLFKSLNIFNDDVELVAESLFEALPSTNRRIIELAMVTVIRNFTLCFIDVLATIGEGDKSLEDAIITFRNLGLADGLEGVFKSMENPQNVDRFRRHYKDYEKVFSRLIEYCKKNDLMKKELVN